MGPEAKQDVLDGVWSIFTTTWEAAAGAAFPSKVAGATKALDSVDRLAAALAQLQTECADRMRETEQARAESAKRMEEIISLRPFPGKEVKRAEARSLSATISGRGSRRSSRSWPPPGGDSRVGRLRRPPSPRERPGERATAVRRRRRDRRG